MLAKFFWVECESGEKEEENFCVVFTNSIKWARATTAKKCFATIKPFAFLPLSLPSPSSLLKLSYCYPEILLPW